MTPESSTSSAFKWSGRTKTWDEDKDEVEGVEVEGELSGSGG